MAWSEETRIDDTDAGELIRRGAREQLDGNLDKAESLFREAERVLTSALERSENDAAVQEELPLLLRELSRLHILQSAHDRAEPLLRRLLTITEAQGQGRPEVATVLASLAAVRHSLGDYASAEQLYRQALTIRETTLAPNHVTTAATMESLAESCAARGRFTEAVALCNRALTIREVTLGANDASVRMARKRIADLQMEAHEESRITTPPRATPVQQSTADVMDAPLEARASGAILPPRGTPVPWTDEFAAVREELESTLPAAIDERAPRRSSHSTAVHAPPTTVIGIAAAVVVLLLVLGVKQFAGRPERNTFVEAEPYNPAARVAMQQAIASPVASPPVPAAKDTIVGTSNRDGPKATPLPRDSRAAPVKTVAAEVRRPPATAPAAPVVKAPVADSAPTRAIVPAVEKAPEPKVRVEVNAPTSPTLIGTAPQPTYPESLRDQQVEGEVVVQFVVDETGRPDVSSMTVVRSPHVLLTNALRAVLPQFRFEPARTAPPQSTPRPETVRYAFTFRAPRR